MILIVGIDGLLGNYLYKKLSKYFKVIGTSRKKSSDHILRYDILNPISDLKLEWDEIESVIITAACSKVDFCELNPEYSKAVNLTGIIRIVNILEKKNIPVIVFSSEYVFDGKLGGYTELSKRSPINNYGKQKKQLEDFVINYDKSTIFRVSKLSSITYKNTFMHKMINEIKNNDNYNAAVDQFFTPINIDDCAEIILTSITKKIFGIFNLCGIENYSRYSLALKLKNNLNLDTDIKKCNISDINSKYKIPPDLTMSCEKIIKEFNFIPTKLKLF